jgi:hypothetical protein
MPATPPTPATFFADKNRAFWLLQAAGWAGYLLLRAAQGVANGMTISFFIPVLVSTATGYSLTLVMAALYRWLILKSPLVIWTGTVATVAVGVGAYSIIDAWVFSLINRAGVFEGGLVLARRCNCSSSKRWPRPRSSPCCAISSIRISCSTR